MPDWNARQNESGGDFRNYCAACELHFADDWDYSRCHNAPGV